MFSGRAFRSAFLCTPLPPIKSVFVLNLCAFASLADVAEEGDGAKSALREIFSAFVSFVIFPYCDLRTQTRLRRYTVPSFSWYSSNREKW
jgi:hypothetical protein